MIYLVFVLAFAMTGVAAFEFVCLKFTETTNRKLRRRIAVLERTNSKLEGDMTALIMQLDAVAAGGETGSDENWPEVILDEKRL